MDDRALFSSNFDFPGSRSKFFSIRGRQSHLNLVLPLRQGIIGSSFVINKFESILISLTMFRVSG